MNCQQGRKKKKCENDWVGITHPNTKVPGYLISQGGKEEKKNYKILKTLGSHLRN